MNIHVWDVYIKTFLKKGEDEEKKNGTFDNVGHSSPLSQNSLIRYTQPKHFGQF